MLVKNLQLYNHLYSQKELCMSGIEEGLGSHHKCYYNGGGSAQFVTAKIGISIYKLLINIFIRFKLPLPHVFFPFLLRHLINLISTVHILI